MLPLWACVGVACVTATSDVRARASRLEAEAERCASFAEFEQRLARERKALDTAPGADLVPASQSLSVARRRCAQATVDGLFERQQAKGREAAAVEVEALTRAYGAEEATRLLRTRWGTEADGFLPEVASSGFTVGPTPAQEAPKEPTGPTHEPQVPTDDTFGEGARCLRLAPGDAAACLAEWRRDGADEKDLDAAVRTLVARVQRQAKLLDDDGRAALLGDVLRGLALPRERPVLAPLFADLARLTDALVKRAEALAVKGQPERAAVLVRPLLLVDESRRRVEPFALEASQKHARLSTDARQRTLAAHLHRHLAAWFLGKEEPRPAFEPGQWSVASWVCQLPAPTLPALPAGMSARLVARCRQLPKVDTQQQVDPSMRTFDLEGSFPRVRVDADVSLTCGGKQTTSHLTIDEVVMEGAALDPESVRPHVLEPGLVALVAKAEKACVEKVREDAAAECQRLDGDPLDVTQAFTQHALRLGEWPACFRGWFTKRYGLPPPPLR